MAPHTPPAPHLVLVPSRTPLSRCGSVAPQTGRLSSEAPAPEALQHGPPLPPVGSFQAPPSVIRLPVPELGC